jgi:hypothetical protein
VHVHACSVLLHNVGKPVHMRRSFRCVRKVSCQATCMYDISTPEGRYSDAYLGMVQTVVIKFPALPRPQQISSFVRARAPSTSAVRTFVAVTCRYAYVGHSPTSRCLIEKEYTRRGADKSLAFPVSYFPICGTTKRVFLGWVKEVRTTKS